jgi:hypothetical protein
MILFGRAKLNPCFQIDPTLTWFCKAAGHARPGKSGFDSDPTLEEVTPEEMVMLHLHEILQTVCFRSKTVILI